MPAGNPGGHMFAHRICLLKGDRSSGAAVKHTDEDRRDLAALDRIARAERSLHIGTGQDTGAVEVIDLCRKRRAGLHVGDRIVRNRVDHTQVLCRRAENVYKFRA